MQAVAAELSGYAGKFRCSLEMREFKNSLFRFIFFKTGSAALRSLRSLAAISNSYQNSLLRVAAGLAFRSCPSTRSRIRISDILLAFSMAIPVVPLSLEAVIARLTPKIGCSPDPDPNLPLRDSIPKPACSARSIAGIQTALPSR
jgi:hypothetical protein